MKYNLTEHDSFARQSSIRRSKPDARRTAHLEHAAHYAIGVLATIMFLKISYEIPELFTGLVGAGLISLGFITSRIYNKRRRKRTTRYFYYLISFAKILNFI